MSEELELEGKFLDAETLGLTEKQRCGLVKTLAWLEAGKLDHENEKTAGFDMGRWGGSCGSVCCIGGTAEVLGETNFHISIADIGKEHVRLFYPGSTNDPLSFLVRTNPGWKASTSQAAVALRGYLETGRADWDAAMKTPSNRRTK